MGALRSPSLLILNDIMHYCYRLSDGGHKDFLIGPISLLRVMLQPILLHQISLFYVKAYDMSQTQTTGQE